MPQVAESSQTNPANRLGGPLLITHGSIRAMLIASMWLGGWGAPTATVQAQPAGPVRVQEYSIQDLGSLGGTEGEAEALNDYGVVVGWSRTAGGQKHAFSWTAGGGMIDLGTLGGSESEARGVNNQGEIAGWSHYIVEDELESTHAFLWLPAPRYGLPPGMNDLGLPPAWDMYSYCEARDINDDGWVVGRVESGEVGKASFLWRDGVWTVLDPPELQADFSVAQGINAHGQIVGWWAKLTPPLGVSKGAYFWSEATGFVDMYARMEPTSYPIAVYEVNDHTQAVIFPVLECTGGAPYCWHLWDGGTLSGLPGACAAYPYGLNNALQVVGGGNEGWFMGGRLWDEGSCRAIADLVPATSDWERGTDQFSAKDINNRGQVVGAGRHLPTASFRPYLLTPAPMDCNSNGVDDCEDIAQGTSDDCDSNGIPDECEPDCNTNGAADGCDIATGTSRDCNSNGLPDECEDCNRNRAADECDIGAGTSWDENTNGVPDECEPCPGLIGNGDADANGIIDLADYAAFAGCLKGPGIWAPLAYRFGDMDGDCNVDLRDFAAFQPLMTRPTSPPPPVRAYWNFDEGSGSTAADSSGHQYDGSLFGPPDWVAGRYGTGLEFWGSDEVRIPETFDDTVSAGFALTCWVYWHGATENAYIFDARGLGANTGFILYLNSAGHGVSYLYTPGGYSGVTSVGAVPVENWTHLAAVFDSTSQALRVYINGEPDNAATYTAAYIPANLAAMGNNVFGGSDRPFRGVIDEVRFYDSALSGDQVRWIYQHVPVLGPGTGFSAGRPGPGRIRI